MRLNKGQEAVTEMNSERIALDIIPRLRDRRGENCPPIHVTMAPSLSNIHFGDGNFETLLEKFLDHVLVVSHPSGRIRIGIYKKKSASDLEQFFKISPFCWVHLNVQIESESGIEDGVKEILNDLDFHCPEWIGVEGSEAQLGAFHFENRELPSLVVFIRNLGSRRSCDFLIPVVESVPSLAHAV